jgi:hypothetical protein
VDRYDHIEQFECRGGTRLRIYAVGAPTPELAKEFVATNVTLRKDIERALRQNDERVLDAAEKTLEESAARWRFTFKLVSAS